jgi:hypothetical protein
MSLLDDASIVITPNGVKAGELYAVIPVPTEGAEEVTNEDFATDTGWTKGTGWTISGGAANASATTAALVHIGSLGTVANVRYLISMDVTVISGTVRVRNSSGWVETEISSSNTYNYYAILGSSSSLVIEGISSFTGSINSISIKEYTAADMDVTRATAATRIDENGLVEDVLSGVPRIDYTGGGCPHILAEPMRTNLVTYSEDFSNALWGKQVGGIGSTPIVTSDYATSPDGTLNADRIQLSLNGGTSSADQSYINYSITSGTESTGSIYVKTADGSSKTIYLRTSTAGGLATKTITSDWTRIEQTESVGDFFVFGLRGGFGTSDSTDLLVWGGQYERGSYATSYIPTSGGTVTRNQETFSRDGIGSLINSTEGSIFGEGSFSESSISGQMYFATLSDGSTNNRLEIRQSVSNLQFLWRAGGSYQGAITTSGIDVGVNFKFLVNYSATEITFYVNGGLIGTIATPTLYSAGTLNRLGLDRGDSYGDFFFGKVLQLGQFTVQSHANSMALTS